MVLAMLCVCTQAIAQQKASTYLTVSVRVVPNCHIAITDLSFGAYDPLQDNATQPLDATADVRMRCTKNSQANIVLDYGRSARGEFRTMTAGRDTVNYELFQDASRSKPWGMGEHSLRIISAGGTDPQRFTVYGRVSAGQEVPPGAYTDIVLATVDF